MQLRRGVIIWLINSVSDSIGQTIMVNENSIDVWEDLKERFSKIDHVLLSNLRSQLNSLKQRARFVLEYFIGMKTLLDELSVHRPILTCICFHQRRCEAIRLVLKFVLEDQDFSF